eukprot:TRINITY_DN3649_c0_g2_i2.p1 TRINITY_DN3649_c0_g2~~TRINITY_DN3649_c0_g2_i2.p1  ORF type:complete len:108 (-),score=16.12 TRINITY_DN3649_c0_g2_i2:54-377(-)
MKQWYQRRVRVPVPLLVPDIPAKKVPGEFEIGIEVIPSPLSFCKESFVHPFDFWFCYADKVHFPSASRISSSWKPTIQCLSLMTRVGNEPRGFHFSMALIASSRTLR